ncbi:oxidoreductase [Tropicimonas sp. IMCC6043]|uniref:oxidoreductase n=1 Tax=Tropicimonas sp. IMCC6043 TaxID=2510645 RepID=UPI00101BE1CC|nr:oxidoreductase [Tropicimonas sp. IMCC6043]RYH11229.1 SDR family NAD(P)-dependent oxidoreductase [Tropicimonas sp. IMCC6043]
MARRYSTALVTGASSGMGKDIALRLLKEGLTVYVAARSVDRMADLAEAGAIPIAMDITKDAEITAAAEQIHAGHGGVDILVNNAGFGQYGPVEETPIDSARYQFEVNLFGLARLTQLLLPPMRQNRKGLVINISSMGGKIYTPLGAWYHVTKHALEGWSDCLRLELAEFGIDVVIAEPGLINTGFTAGVQTHFAASAESAYAGLIGKLVEAVDSDGASSPPSVISDLVIRAIRADRPRTRYAGGKMARPVLFLRWLISDRMFDRMIMSRFT